MLNKAKYNVTQGRRDKTIVIICLNRKCIFRSWMLNRFIVDQFLVVANDLSAADEDNADERYM